MYICTKTIMSYVDDQGWDDIEKTINNINKRAGRSQNPQDRDIGSSVAVHDSMSGAGSAAGSGGSVAGQSVDRSVQYNSSASDEYVYEPSEMNAIGAQGMGGDVDRNADVDGDDGDRLESFEYGDARVQQGLVEMAYGDDNDDGHNSDGSGGSGASVQTYSTITSSSPPSFSDTSDDYRNDFQPVLGDTPPPVENDQYIRGSRALQPTNRPIYTQDQLAQAGQYGQYGQFAQSAQSSQQSWSTQRYVQMTIDGNPVPGAPGAPGAPSTATTVSTYDEIMRERRKQGTLERFNRLAEDYLMEGMKDKKFIMHGGCLVTIPPALADFAAITNLTLKGMELEMLDNIPPCVEYLYVDSNNLRELDETKLPKTLKTISANDNQIVHIRMANSGVMSLFLARNPLTGEMKFPKVMSELRLTSSKIPDLESLKECVIINLGIARTHVQTDLHDIPDSVVNLDATFVPITIVSSLPPNLETLKMQSCGLQLIDTKFPKTLSDLDLHKNYLKEVPFLPRKMKSLDLSANKIEKIPEFPDTITDMIDFKDNPASNDDIDNNLGPIREALVVASPAGAVIELCDDDMMDYNPTTGFDPWIDVKSRDAMARESDIREDLFGGASSHERVIRRGRTEENGTGSNGTPLNFVTDLFSRNSSSGNNRTGVTTRQNGFRLGSFANGRSGRGSRGGRGRGRRVVSIIVACYP